jgi:hypothetical protein
MQFLIVTKNKTKIEVTRTLVHARFESRRAHKITFHLYLLNKILVFRNTD